MFRKTDRLHRQIFEKNVSNTFGIHRSQHMMLMYISRNQSAGQKDIAKEFQISPAAVTVTLKKLELGGFIVRNLSKNDNRCNNITLTEKGKKVICDTEKLFMLIDFAMVDGLTDDELTLLSSCLEKMHKNLNNGLKYSSSKMKGNN